MATIELFPTDQIVGVFRGFQAGGLEFHADLTLPYRSSFQQIPMHGQFLLVQLENPDEAVLGRISALSADGRLSSTAGEEFNIRAVRDQREVPENLREDYLRYRVTMRVLGVVRKDGMDIVFAASHRRLPHVGIRVAFLNDGLLRELTSHNDDGAHIGHLAMGEFVYAQGAEGFRPKDDPDPWIRVSSPDVCITFPIRSLVSRRSFVFARAGFGKSNLVKLLFSELYRETPTVEKRGGREEPVGTIIFDPDGEYFWPDDKGRPGLCDVDHLRDKLVVFTPRHAPTPFYASFTGSGIKLDLRRLKPGDVISLALSPDRQEQQNVRKLAGLNSDKWERLIDLVHEHGYESSDQDIAHILGLNAAQNLVEIGAARSNIVGIVRRFHDPASRFLDLLLTALGDGKVCVVDLSQMRGQQGFILSSLLLRRIFENNQDQFTKAEPETIPVIAVVEEAQSVLDDRSSAGSAYVEWVKEGRKYDLGAVLITQQPWSIPVELLSQGDNWFVFHLLSGSDLTHLKGANAHFSNDLLSSLLNEPLVGHGIVWSSASKRPYPLPIRSLSFERRFAPDPDADRASSVGTYAAQLRAKASTPPPPQPTQNGQAAPLFELDQVQPVGTDGRSNGSAQDGLSLTVIAAKAIRDNPAVMQRLATTGVPWGHLRDQVIKPALPEITHNRDEEVRKLVRKALNEVFGEEGKGGWHGFTNPATNGYWARSGPKPAEE